ncbi:MAG TPA: ABC transporter ATP-binding protein/permease [Anaerolineae bacterium]|nr:ABC transporter ATP-binding protein/permease [Anaerolineae bacterium]HQI83125.1 ABC transporter ATP-binding protein/permease [Anaerolineae bacterium]
MQPAIHTRNLTKWFPKPRRLSSLLRFKAAPGETLAVDGVSFDVQPGEIFGLVGPNGAGKTTLVKLLTTLILPTSGEAQVGGYDCTDEAPIKAMIGLMTCNERSFYPRLSGRENLRFYAGLLNLSPAATAQRIEELADLLDLREFLDKRYDLYSLGMKHRLALARSLLNRPTLLFLDEPTRSLDPLAAARFREALFTLARREGCTIFLVTHDLNEAVELCDRVGVMVRGLMRVVDDPARLRPLLASAERCTITARGFAATTSDRIRAIAGVHSLTIQEAPGGVAILDVAMADRKHTLSAIIRALEESGSEVAGLEFTAASWDEVFEKLEGKTTDKGNERWEETTDGRNPRWERAASREEGRGENVAGAVKTGRAAEASERAGIAGWRAIGGRGVEVARKAWLFLRRDFQTQFSYRFSFVMQILGILFSVASFYFVAQLFGAQANPYLNSYGGDYFAFVLIGIAFTGYQGVALYSFSGVIQSAQSMGTLEAMLVTPTRLSTLLFGSSLWNFAFTSLRVIVYLLMGVLIFDVNLRGANLLAALVILLLTILSLSSIGILSACFIIVFKQGNPLNFVIGSVSSLLSGVYYPVAVLPVWLQVVAKVYPLTYTLDAMRRALLTGASALELLPEIGVLAGFSLVLLPLSLLAFREAVKQARRDGSLTQF